MVVMNESELNAALRNECEEIEIKGSYAEEAFGIYVEERRSCKDRTGNYTAVLGNHGDKFEWYRMKSYKPTEFVICRPKDTFGLRM